MIHLKQEVWVSRYHYHCTPFNYTVHISHSINRMGGSSQNKAEVKQEIPSDRASSGSRKVSERYRNPSADVELISSDGTSFMIHSYHLLSTR